MIIHKVEERRCTRRHVPSSFSHKEETRPLCGARAGPAKHLGLSVWETNRRPFGARCGDAPLWITLDNQHPWHLVYIFIEFFVKLFLFSYHVQTGTLHLSH
ncbi:hypothetical protein [Aneurinibacillus aneurinilyticus]|uniref:hypothetical protein n=1 Tax=Aneurinibacillus aneurinilyticus TaxID=1391 RepID=UPI0035268B70